jgi:hypothetical protein
MSYDATATEHALILAGLFELRITHLENVRTPFNRALGPWTGCRPRPHRWSEVMSQMPEAIKDPTFGWNELPHERGSYAWWDGQQFTTIVFRADDHWEYVNDEAVPLTHPQRSFHHNPFAWVGLWLGIADFALLSFLFGAFIGPAGIVLGILGAIRADRRSERRASAAAIVLGCVGTLFGVMWLVITSDPNFVI